MGIRRGGFGVTHIGDDVRFPNRLAFAALCLGASLACAAPRSEPIEGPVVEAIREGLASGTERFDHAAWDGLLREFVDHEGRVDYLGLLGQRARLDEYLAAIGAADLRTLRRSELLALLINAYNACTVKLILDHAGDGDLPESIRDIPSPWKTKLCLIGGERLTLDEIEHGLVRPLFGDPRIHAAVNCASGSCPRLASWAFTGETLEAQLEQSMREMVNSTDHVRVHNGRLEVSKIFDWYGGDFGGSRQDVASYVKSFAAPELLAQIEALGERPKVRYLDYDWSLNAR